MTSHSSTAPVPESSVAWIDRAVGRLSFLNAAIASITIVFMMLLVCADILSRNLFSVPVPGVADVLAYAIVGCVFMQLGSTIRNGRLVRALFLTEALEKRRPGIALGLDTLFALAALALMLLVSRYLWQDFAGSWRDAEFLGAAGAYQIPTWPFKLAVAFGATIATVEVLFALFRQYRASLVSGGAARLTAGLIAAGILAAGLFAIDSMAAAGLDRLSIGVGAFVGLFLLISLGMPIVFALMITSFIAIWLVRDNLAVAINSVGISASSAVRSYGFGVIPLFVLMGLLLDKAGVGRDAFQIMATLVRRMAGGLGVATVGANAIFASITGSSIASATVFSRIAVPPMTEAGYSKRFALGIVAGSSVLGMLIPPSLLMIVYGLLAETSIGDLFIAGIVPGLLLALAFAAIIVLISHFFPSYAGDTGGDTDLGPVSTGDVLRRLVPVVLIVVLVMGGIYGGFFSPTEAGAAGAFGALVVALARRSLDWDAFRQLVIETGAITSGLLFLIIAANVYGRALSMSTVPMFMADFIGGLDLTLIGFTLLYMLLVVLLGMILDSVSIMLIILPIALPVVAVLGGDPIWFGIVTVIAIEIGLLTPPFGLSVYVVKGSLPEGYASLSDIFVAAAPFALVMAAVTVLLIAVPGIATMLL